MQKIGKCVFCASNLDDRFGIQESGLVIPKIKKGALHHRDLKEANGPRRSESQNKNARPEYTYHT